MAPLTVPPQTTPEAPSFPRRRLRGARFAACLALFGLFAGTPREAKQAGYGTVPELAYAARLACTGGHPVFWVKPFLSTNPSGEKMRQAIVYLERL